MPAKSIDLHLESHRTRLGACVACGSRDEGVVPIQSLARRPRAMLVGQAPGKTETVDQRPFAGRAGRTLFKWLAVAGASEESFRRRVYIAAITRCYPGPSGSGRGDRVPTTREQDTCSQWLDAELRLIRPRLLIPVGRLAISRLVGDGPLDSLVGRELEVEHSGGVSVAIPLPHPSGASSWIHEKGHSELLERALDLLRSRLAESLYL